MSTRRRRFCAGAACSVLRDKSSSPTSGTRHLFFFQFIFVKLPAVRRRAYFRFRQMQSRRIASRSARLYRRYALKITRGSVAVALGSRAACLGWWESFTTERAHSSQKQEKGGGGEGDAAPRERGRWFSTSLEVLDSYGHAPPVASSLVWPREKWLFLSLPLPFSLPRSLSVYLHFSPSL